MVRFTTQKAFTIIELMVVVAIIAILTAIIMTNLTSAKTKSRDAKRVSDIVQLQLALELFFDRCNQYPTIDPATIGVGKFPMPNLAATNGCPPNISLATFTSKIPTPPVATSGDYRYAVNSATTPTDYILQAKLELPSQALNDDLDTPLPGWNTDSGIVCSDTPVLYYCAQPR